MRIAALLVALVLTFSSTSVEAKHRPRKPVAAEVVPAPKIVRQTPDGNERVMITIQNTGNKDLWVYVECPKVLTVEPVSVQAHHTIRLNLHCPGGAGGTCIINHWVVQQGSPPMWLPYAPRR